MLKIAAIDVGSNAIRMTVGEVDDAWNVRVTENIRTPVRLGQDVFSGGTLEEISMRQVEAAFRRFRRVIDDAGVYRSRAVATSATREATNGDVLVERVRQASGIELEVIDGVEEARLIHLAVIHALDLKNKPTLLVDIGGGSVEVTLAQGRTVIFTESYRIGAVRLLKIMENGNTYGPVFGGQIEEYAGAAARQIRRAIGKEKIFFCVGTGGNVVELGRLRQKLFSSESDRVITQAELKKLVDMLCELSPGQITRKYGVRPDRADVLLAGAIVLQAIAAETKVKEIAIPNVGLKEGILYELADELAQKPHPERRQALLESARHMGEKYQFDAAHAELTRRLAWQLFEQAQALHGLDDDDLLLLEVGALLHDIGHFISTIDHDKHGYYLLRANHLIGLSEREQAIVANIVRYHRGKLPGSDEEDLQELPAKDRHLALKLAALLSLADGLDVSHTSQVRQVRLEPHGSAWKLRVPPYLMAEKWAISKRKALFQDVFGVKLETE